MGTILVRRYRADGTLDATYGTNGETVITVSNSHAFANDVAVRPLGEAAVAVGIPVGEGRQAKVARLTPQGQPDASFAGGVATALYPIPPSVFFQGLGETLDGKLIAAGVSGPTVIVARFNRDGSFDTSFGTGGRVLIRPPGGPTEVGAFEVLPDGKLLIGGGGDSDGPLTGSFVLIRLNPNGTPDTTFGNAGVATAPMISFGTAGVQAVAFQADGKILATGVVAAHFQLSADFATARFNSDGSLDTTFGTGGVVRSDPGPGEDVAADVVVLSGGDILVGGRSRALPPNGHSEWSFVRYHPDGTPVLDFGNQFNRPGVLRFTPGMGGELQDLIALPADGFLGAGTGFNDFALVRLLSDGTPDPTFGSGGAATAGFAGTTTSFLAVAVDRQADGKLVVGGFVRPTLGSGTFAVARFSPNGSLDATFGQGGRTLLPLPPTGSVYEMQLMSDGGIVMVGMVSGSRTVLVRLRGDPAPATTVTGRHVFYNDSAFDVGDARVTLADLAAVAPDKQALTPGQTSSFANVTSYSRGINGVLIDLATIPPAELLPGDFEFRTGRSPDPSSWPAAPGPTSVALLPGPVGANGARYAITWADGAIRNAWLRVTLKATARTGLTSPDVFYFGNLVGDTGSTPARVDISDYFGARAALGRRGGPADPFDFDRDGRMTSLDLLTVRRNFGKSLPAVQPAAVPAAQPTSGLRRRSVYQALDAD